MSSLKPSNTTAFILGAGKGERMRPLTEKTPKPLLRAGPHRLIEYHLYALKNAGFKNVVINTAYLAEQFPTVLGTGRRYGLNISYSDESLLPPLDTAGGIINALPLIKSEQFILINGDVFCDYQFSDLLAQNSSHSAHQSTVVLVSNPEHNPDGDFSVSSSMLLQQKSSSQANYTYSGIGLFSKRFFEPYTSDASARPIQLGLGKALRDATKSGSVSATISNDTWLDIGTPERLAQLDQRLSSA